MIGGVSRAPRVVLTYGRFDGFHQHHVRFLGDIARLGDEVIVGCVTDALAEAMGQTCQMPFETRRALLQGCRYVSRVIPQIDPAQMRTDIVNYNAAALAIAEEFTGQFDDLHDIAQIHYLPRNISPRINHFAPVFEKQIA